MKNNKLFEVGSPEMHNCSNGSEDGKNFADDVEKPKTGENSKLESQYDALLVPDTADYSSDDDDDDDDDVFNDESTCTIGKHKCGPGFLTSCWNEATCMCDIGHQQLPEIASSSYEIGNADSVKKENCADGIKIGGPIIRSKKVFRDIGTPYSAKSAVERRSKSKLYKLELPEAVDIYYRRLTDRICRKREPQFHVTQQEEMMRVFEMEMEELEENDEVFEGWSLPSSPVYPEHWQYSNN
ncbi:hypothetical protein CRE_21442 [Caenorhabditis remanei]|uniref:Uncharacterized protein n=1 Tax=Caenorhabditis remanei TaxID=31234 RepID=E3N3N6_CAERE|nr:hypothetical protein CRE_21442 [Caenorhabditis remanei]